MPIINLTPHDVVVLSWTDDVETHRYPRSGEVARLATIELGQHLADGAPVEYVEFGHLDGGPERVDGTWYIVSLPTALASRRPDFLVPYQEVRDETGRILGCRTLARSI